MPSVTVLHQGYIVTWSSAELVPAIQQAKLATVFLFYAAFLPREGVEGGREENILVKG